MDIVLASTSKYRRELLERTGLTFRSLAPSVDESGFQQQELEPATIASLLAIAKAESLIGLAPDAAIIGSDQVVDLDGELLGKPGSVEGAIAQLQKMAGREHRLITAVAVWHQYRTRLHIEITKLRMRPLFRHEIERYVAFDNPIDCAGSYKIESQGIALFEQIDTQDYTSIIGLPLLELVAMLRNCGIQIP
ncbi:septum formation protein Maf [bacterium]|nr:septum formation protein Maf [bacterium]